MSRPPRDAEDGDGFLSRWSRRKRSDLPGEEAEVPEAGVAEAPDPAPEDTRSDAEILEDLGLPDPDDLKEGDDFSGFMNGAVPTRLRNRALRKLWLSNPVLANLDEMVDYGEDFTDAATVVENLQTAYQVGKGWLKDAMEESEEADEAETEIAKGSELPSGEKAALTPDENEGPLLEVEEVAEEPDEVTVSEPPIAEAEPALPRRMRFRFENG